MVQTVSTVNRLWWAETHMRWYGRAGPSDEAAGMEVLPELVYLITLPLLLSILSFFFSMQDADPERIRL